MKKHKTMNIPTDDQIETAAIDYREVSDNENTDEDDNIQVNWYDKQNAFIAGVKWYIENYINQ